MRNSNGSNEFVYIPFLLRYVYNSKFLLLLHSLLGLARATCVDFVYEFSNVCTKATTSVPPPPPTNPPHIALCSCVVHVLKNCFTMFQNMRHGRTKYTGGS